MKKTVIKVSDLQMLLEVLFNDIDSGVYGNIDNEGSTVSFDFTVENGVVGEFDENSHYGLIILSDEDSKLWVNTLMNMGLINDNVTNGLITIERDEITVEDYTK